MHVFISSVCTAIVYFLSLLLLKMPPILDRHCYLPLPSLPSGRSTQNYTTLPYFSCSDILFLLSSSKIQYSAENT